MKALQGWEKGLYHLKKEKNKSGNWGLLKGVEKIVM